MLGEDELELGDDGDGIDGELLELELDDDGMDGGLLEELELVDSQALSAMPIALASNRRRNFINPDGVVVRIVEPAVFLNTLNCSKWRQLVTLGG